jgi:hypothetical protein
VTVSVVSLAVIVAASAVTPAAGRTGRVLRCRLDGGRVGRCGGLGRRGRGVVPVLSGLVVSAAVTVVAVVPLAVAGGRE